jgi:cold shock CspA family protein
VKHFGLKGGFGFIIPDGISRRDHAAKDLIFVHRNDIKTSAPSGDGKDGEPRYYPR